MDDINSAPRADLTELAADIISAYVANNSVPVAELPALIHSVHAAICVLGQPVEAGAPEVEKATPAQIRKSIQQGGLISFIDGKSYQTLRRHLTKHGLDDQSYRARYGLPVDYPMVAPGYSERRSALALSLGLGRKDGEPAAASEPVEPAPSVEAEAPKRGGRRKKADA